MLKNAEIDYDSGELKETDLRDRPENEEISSPYKGETHPSYRDKINQYS